MLTHDTPKRLFLACLLVACILGLAGWQENGRGVPSGSIVFVTSGQCPWGFIEVSELNGRTLEFTVAANADVGTTGGSDSITPAGSIAISGAPSATTTFKAASSGTNTTVASSTHTHTSGSFTGTSFDNRPAFIKVIGCKAN